MAFVDIIKPGGIIIQNVYLVLLVPGCLLVGFVISKSKKIWDLADKRRLNSVRISTMKKKLAKKNQTGLMAILFLMGLPPHRALLLGVRPIWVATKWVLYGCSVYSQYKSIRHHSLGTS